MTSLPPSDALSLAGATSREATERTSLLKHPASAAARGRRADSSSSGLSSLSSSSSESSLTGGDDGTAADVERDAAVALLDGPPPPPRVLSPREMSRVMLVLLIGVFVAHADGSLVLATHPVIASEFGALAESSWLFTSFGLAGAATQTLYGKLSDIYGRKALILASYVFFAGGCLIVGIGQSMTQVILGRILSGGGGAGMTVLVSILITDLVPVREVATWRAYVNVAATTGRSIGGPLGGWLADVVGWRWSFIGQVPVLAVALVLCSIYVPRHTVPEKAAPAPNEATSSAASSKGGRLWRVDFLGAALLGALVLCFLFPLEVGGVQIAWSSPVIWSLFAAGAVLVAVFYAVEKWWAREPILPLQVFHQRDAVLSYLIMALQVAAQVGLMFSVPLYFQVTEQVSNTEAGAHLIPAVVGNAVGGILSGVIINKTGRYKSLILIAAATSSVSYILLLVRWHGKISWWESLEIIPGGFGTGIAQSAIFISLQAAVDVAFVAPAVSTLYLSTNVGMIMGLGCISAVLQAYLRSGLESRLLKLGLDDETRGKIIAKAVSSVEYIYKAKGDIAVAVEGAYLDGLWYSHGLSLVYSTLAFVGGLFLRERKL